MELTNNELIAQLKAAVSNDPSLAKQLSSYLLSGSPDPNPATEKNNPLFFNSSKNITGFTYEPTKGFGFQKDGTKFHGFSYDCIYNSRSKDLFGTKIKKAKAKIDAANVEAGKSESKGKNSLSASPDGIMELSSILTSAYTDLIINGNSDMPSYLYLADNAVYALSDPVKSKLGDLQYDGGVALGLVTELCAAVEASTLFKKAVTDRADEILHGIEALNEMNINKAFTYLTPSVQTQGLLLNKGVDMNSNWAQNLTEKAPSLDELVRLPFQKLQETLGDEISKRDTNVVHDMYAGLYGKPVSSPIPSARTYLAQNDLGMENVAAIEEAMADGGHEQLSSMDPNDVTDLIKKLYECQPSNEEEGSNTARSPSEDQKPPPNESGEDESTKEAKPDTEPGPAKEEPQPIESGKDESTKEAKPDTEPGPAKEEPQPIESGKDESTKKPQPKMESGSAKEENKYQRVLKAKNSGPNSQYRVLGVSENATDKEINKAYKKLSLKIHPDKAAPEEKEIANEAMSAVNVASGVLLDPEKRKAYDEATRKEQCKVLSKTMKARQDEQEDIRKGKELKPVKEKSSSLGSKVREASKLSSIEKAGSKLTELGSFGAEDIMGMAGGGLADLAGGPAGIAVMLAQQIAAGNNKIVEQAMTQASQDRKKAAAKANSLLANVLNLSNEQDAEKRQQMASDLLQSVSKPDSFAFSQQQGMDLQNQLNKWATTFGPTNGAAIPPYANDVELVASVDSGRILSALSLFVIPDKNIAQPDRLLFQEPKFVKMMGAAEPFHTFTHRSTSESETMSFIKSSKLSSKSTATKSTATTSSSSKIHENVISAAGTAKNSSASSSSNSSNNSHSTASKSNYEHNDKATEAFVAEFTFMPMKSIRLVEGGLVLSDYAYYRLQRITTDDSKKYIRAKDFLKQFGSHIPFGTQTLGGIFVRKMRIVTEEETSLSTMYSSASSELTNINARSQTISSTGAVTTGIFGIGASASNSSGMSTANSSGHTSINNSATGSGTGSKSTNASFNSNVICYGPNAATQENFYQQLMANNATWTVIDRGETDSYLPIWDFIDYLGQGGLFSEEIGLLQSSWEEMALTNDMFSNSVLLESIMTNYYAKKRLFEFVKLLIVCLHTTGNATFGSKMASQFENVLNAAIRQQSIEIQDDPSKFIEAGFSDPQFVGQPRLFKLSSSIPEFEDARAVMLQLAPQDWTEFRYYEVYTDLILDKAKTHYLLELCQKSKNENSAWIAVESIVNSYHNEKPSNETKTNDTEAIIADVISPWRDFVRMLKMKDATTGWMPLHYAAYSNNPDMFEKMYNAYPQAALAVAPISQDVSNFIEQVFSNNNLLSAELCSTFEPKLKNKQNIILLRKIIADVSNPINEKIIKFVNDDLQPVKITVGNLAANSYKKEITLPEPNMVVQNEPTDKQDTGWKDWFVTKVHGTNLTVKWPASSGWGQDLMLKGYYSKALNGSS